MAITPSGGSGYLVRSSNNPTGATGYTWCAWVRISGNATNFDSIWENGLDSSNYIGVAVNTGGTQIAVYSGSGLGQNVVDPGANTWLFLCLKQTATTTIRVLNRLETATTLSDTGNLTSQEPLATWSQRLLNSGAGELGAVVQLHAFKEWNAALSDAEIWEESVRLLPRRRANLDSFLPLYGASGADEGGLARNWTVTGTPAVVALNPRITRGGGSSAVLLPTSGGVTGTVAAVLSGLVAAGAGSPEITGTAAAVLSGLVAAAEGSSEVSGTAAAVLAGLVAVGAGSTEITGAAAAVLSGLVAAGAGAPEIVGTVDAVLPGLEAAGTGSGDAITGTIDAVLPGLEASCFGTPVVTGTADAILPGLVAEAVGSPVIVGVGSLVLPGLVAAGTDVVLLVPPLGGSFAFLALPDTNPSESVRITDTPITPDSGSFVGYPDAALLDAFSELEAALPAGFAYVIDEDGSYLVDDDGSFLVAIAS